MTLYGFFKNHFYSSQLKDRSSRGAFFFLSGGYITVCNGQMCGPDPPNNNHDETCGQNEAVIFVAARFSDFSVCSHSQVLWALNTSNFLVNFDILLIYADKTCKESAKPM